MKKLKYLLFVLFLIPCMVKADMAAPGLKPYKMVVNDPDGIDYYETDEFKKVEGHLNKNDQFTVTYEYDGSYTIDINKDESYYLSSLDGAVLVKDSVDPVKDKDKYIKQLKNEKEVVVYEKDGVDILEGPAEIYKKVGYAPKGTKLKYKYYVNGDAADDEDETEEDYGVTYIYVEYKGKKGWVNVLEKTIMFPEKQDYITMDDFKISGITIPKNTVIRSYYTFDAWSHSSFIKYKGYEDTFAKYDDLDNILSISKYYALAKKEFKVYTEANNKGTIVTTIPNNAKFISIATYSHRGEIEEQKYVEYNGKRGWIKIDDSEKEYDYLEKPEIANANLLDDEIKEEQEEEKTEEPVEEPVEDVAPSPKKEDNKKSSKKQKPEDYTLTYVIIGASVAVVAIVVIILVNKKSKKNKEVEPVQSTEVKPVVEENKEVVEKEPVVEETPISNEEQPKSDGKVCPNCGEKIEGKFCPECGTKIEED